MHNRLLLSLKIHYQSRLSRSRNSLRLTCCKKSLSQVKKKKFQQLSLSS